MFPPDFQPPGPAPDPAVLALPEDADGFAAAMAPPPPPIRFSRPDYTLPGLEGEGGEDKLTMIGQRVKTWLREYDDYTASRRKHVEAWKRALELLPSDGPTPFKGAARLRAPFTNTAVSRHASQLNQQIVQTEPPFAAVAREEEALDKVRLIESIVTSYLEDADWKGTAREAHLELPTTGACLVGVFWEEVWRQRIDHYTNFRPERTRALAESGVPYHEAVQAGAEMNGKGEIKARFQFVEECIKDGLELRCVPYRDMITLPPRARRTEDLWGMGERLTLRGADLLEGAKRGRYLQSQVDKLLEGQGGAVPERFQSEDLNAALDGGSGLLGSDEDRRYHEFDCVELWVLDDFDDTGEKWHVITAEAESGLVLRAQYSPFDDGHCPYVYFHYLRRPGQLQGASIPERVAIFQDAGDALISLLVDLVEGYAAFRSSFAYDASAGFDVEEFMAAPFQPIFVQNIHGIHDLPIIQNLGGAIAEVMNALELLKEWSETVAAVSNPGLGRETSGDKTLGEVQLVLGQAGQIFEDYAAGVALCWGQVFDRARWRIAQYAKDGKVRFRIAAKPSDFRIDEASGQQVPQVSLGDQSMDAPGGLFFGQVSAAELTADVDFVPAGLGAFPDAQQRLQGAMAAYQLGVKDPLVQQDPQSLIALYGEVLRQARSPLADQLTQRLTQVAQQMEQLQQQAQMIQAAQAAQALAGGQLDQDGRKLDQEAKRAEMERAAQGAPLEQLGSMVGVAGQLAQLGANGNGAQPVGAGG